MNSIKQSIAFLLVLFLISSCSKNGTKALEKGDYYSAVLQSVDKLNKDRDNRKALQVLPNAYKLAKNELLGHIASVKNSNAPFGSELILKDYENLQRMYNEVSNCSICTKNVKLESFSTSLERTRDLASEERYSFASNLLNKGNMASAREAFDSFEILSNYSPMYKDVASKKEEALNLGSIHVVVEPAQVNSRLYKLSSDYFNDQVNKYLLENKGVNRFVQFYNPDEATTISLKPDQIVKLEFLDFNVGQTFLESKKETLESKDSVKTGTVKVRGKDIDAFGKVKANYVYNNKLVTSKGILGLEIIDFKTSKVLLQREFPGEFVWRNEWSTYNGDERALTKDQIRLSNAKEVLPPAPEQLFIEFCKPIHGQVTSQLRKFYRDY